MIISGIDEAGLGPLLGPYCASLISIDYKGQVKDPRKLCYAILREDPQKGKLAVGDSKKIYSPGKLRQLEQTILSFFILKFGELPRSAEDFFRFISGNYSEDLLLKNSDPWHKVILDLALPLAADKDEILRLSEKLHLQFEKKGLALKEWDLRLIRPEQFNLLLNSSANKAQACQKILSPLLKTGLFPEGKMVVDRQGGRRYYGEWLIDLYPGKLLTARQESSRLSLYQVGEAEVSFLVGGDALCFETSLASMTSKYARELYMSGFNSFWKSQLPEIKETAGYYTDGKRFIADLKAAGKLPEETSSLIRLK